MRSDQQMRLICSVCGYFAALAFIVIGGTYTIRASLATVPKPDFLVPEYLTKTSVVRVNAPLETRVQIRPYKLSQPAGTSWRPSLVQGYGRKPAMKNEPVRLKDTSRDSKRAKLEARKKRHEAMDAYASGRRHHR